MEINIPKTSDGQSDQFVRKKFGLEIFLRTYHLQIIDAVYFETENR